MKVGRAQVADVRITDISVSRFHSNIYLCKDGTLAIVDNFSKFGTLKLVKEPLVVDSLTHAPVYLQIGRALLNISSDNKKSCWQAI